VRWLVFIYEAMLLVFSGLGQAAELSSSAESGETRSACSRAITGVEQVAPSEPAGVGVGIVLDEHLLTDGSRDQDYNGGGEVTLSGQHAGPPGWLDQALASLDLVTCPSTRFARSEWGSSHAFAAGLLVFTPRALAAHGIAIGDRPYASEFFVSAGRRYTSADAVVAYDTSLTVGVLGLSAAASVQRALHRLTSSTQPQGWSHQISAGGEPTARYSAARQALFAQYGGSACRGDSKWTVAASVGTVTEASVAVNARFGRVRSPWWAFAPEENTYVQETQPAAPPLAVGAPPEVFAFVGARAKVRVYDAFLEGQFRRSDLTYGEGDLNQVIGEVWTGLELRTSSGWAVQYLARWESPELRRGVGSRSMVWGSFQVSKAFN
jgi:Uncharacterized protein conserved in bacteria (DUF2219)